MVAVERIRVAETGEELKQLQAEKDALQRALHLVEGENTILREGRVRTESFSIPNPRNIGQSHDQPVAKPDQGSAPENDHDIYSLKDNWLQSSSDVAIKSQPNSLGPESAVSLPSEFELLHARGNDGTISTNNSPLRSPIQHDCNSASNLCKGSYCNTYFGQIKHYMWDTALVRQGHGRQRIFQMRYMASQVLCRNHRTWRSSLLYLRSRFTLFLIPVSMSYLTPLCNCYFGGRCRTPLILCMRIFQTNT